MDRYPACKNYFNGKQDLKILSYGCSTGEEVLTLRRYFPTAQIIGTDIKNIALKNVEVFLLTIKLASFILHLVKSKSMDTSMQFSVWLFCNENLITLRKRYHLS